MLIRKKYRFEAAHIVRNCSTKRCSRSIHGHSYIAEIIIESRNLDNGQMVVDFGLLKPHIKDFLDSFDHTTMVWKNDNPDFISFVKKFSERYVIFPVSPTAENIALLILFVCNQILENTQFVNGEWPLSIKSVIVHETETGYAEADYSDISLINYDINDIEFSPAVKKDWSCDIIDKINKQEYFVNEIPDQPYTFN